MFFSESPPVGGERGFHLMYARVLQPSQFKYSGVFCLPGCYLHVSWEKGIVLEASSPRGKFGVRWAQALKAGQTPSRTTTLFTLENVQTCWTYAITSEMFF